MALNFINVSRARDLVLPTLFIIMLASGCGLADRFRELTANKPENAAPPVADPVETPDPSPPAGKCANEHYPVDAELTRVYEITGPAPGKYTLTQMDITEEGFKEERNFESGLRVVNNWICIEEGLRTAEFTNTGAMQSGKFEMETIKSSGVTLPRDPKPGMEFDSTYDVKVKLRAGPVAADATGDVRITNKVISVGQPVDVRGQSFEAVRIDSTISIVISMRGRRMEGAKLNVSNWYGQGVGLVKQETDGTFGKHLLEIASIEGK